MAEHLNSRNFDEKTKGTCIIDFWAEWCGPCVMMAPVFEELSKDYKGKAEFFKVNTEEAPELAQKFNVMGIPCLLITKNGKEIGRIVGFMPKEKLKEKIDGVLG